MKYTSILPQIERWRELSSNIDIWLDEDGFNQENNELAQVVLAKSFEELESLIIAGELDDLIDAYDCTYQGEPILRLVQRGSFTCAEIKGLATRIRKISESRDLKYDGVACRDPINEQELFGWFPVEEAGWRLRHLTDCGLEENAELPWTFYISTPDIETNEKVCNKLNSIGITDFDSSDEPDEDGACAVCVFEIGRNNEVDLRSMAEKISGAVDPIGATLDGIQFYDREEFEQVFGDDVDAES